MPGEELNIVSTTRNKQQTATRRPLRKLAAVLLLIVTLGFFLRVRGLERVGFNEDEINKVHAARAYLHGDFSLNREHPMLMKSMIAISLGASDYWNRHHGASRQISEEMAVRLPNVIFGSLTAVVIFLLAQELFDVQIALLAAFFWSVGTIAIIVNRVAKEDTLLVFFAWLAFYFYYRAKTTSKVDRERSAKWYAAAGASFGLMLASKYFPHYLGILILYWYLPWVRQGYPGLRRRHYFAMFGTCALVFLVADPVILMPSTLKYMLYYVGQGTVTHHGYLMMGHFYYNDPSHFLQGMPIYFYPLLLAIKSPIPLVAALAIGLAEVYRRRRESSYLFVLFMFLMWLVPFSLLNAKWLRWMLSWMPSVYIIAAIGAAKALRWIYKVHTIRMWPLPVPASVVLASAVLLAQPVIAMVKAGPYYSLYLSPLGLGRTGFYFPHDELADVGLRPAIRRICQEAAPGAFVGGEAPPIFEYYFQKFGRDDLHYVDLSSLTPRTSPLAAYLVVEDGRKYVENIAFLRAVEFGERPAWVVSVGSLAAARVYRNTQQETPQIQVATMPGTRTTPVAGPRQSKVFSTSLESGIPIGREPAGARTGIAMPALAAVNIQLQE
jgi:4-amino-4-deoxy-L-arabinose transferase-like glycosyltransferase